MKSFQTKKVLTYSIPLCFIVVLFIVSGISQPASKPDAFKARSNKSDILRKVSAAQMPFIENKGQLKNAAVKYYTKTIGETVFVTEEGELIYSVSKTEDGKPTKGWNINERFVDGSIAQVKGEQKAVTKVNYFRGKDPKKWQNDIATYTMVSLGEVYKGIEAKFKAYGDTVEKLFVIKPNADPTRIRLTIEGAKGLEINGAGELEVLTDPGVVKFTKPIAFQKLHGRKHYIKVAYLVKGNEYGFKLDHYDRGKELVIDPLLASTSLVGSGGGSITSITLDRSGNVYVAGWVSSPDFPITPGAYDTLREGNAPDLFITKLDAGLTTILASTYIGGSGTDVANSLAVDEQGNVFVAGQTDSLDLPIPLSSYDSIFNGPDFDGFVVKLDGNLENLLGATYLGGSISNDSIVSMALDGDGTVYVGGNVYVGSGTESADFPVTPGSYDTTPNGGINDVFLATLDDTLSHLLAATYIGGSGGDWMYSLALGGNGAVYFLGDTISEDFPVVAGSYDTTRNNPYGDIFVGKMSHDLTLLLASTFFGSAVDSNAYSLAVDNNDDVFITGYTNASTGVSDFPVTAEAYDTSYNGNDDAFIAKFDADLKELLASTFLGGSAGEMAIFIALGDDGSIYASGHTGSSDFPTTPGAYDTHRTPDKDDYFISKLDSDLSSVLASTYFWGHYNYWLHSPLSSWLIAPGQNGNLYATRGFTIVKFDGDISAGFNPARISVEPSCLLIDEPFSNHRVSINVHANKEDAQFKYWIRDASYCGEESPTWMLLQDWTYESTCTWNPTSNGRKTIVVWVADDSLALCPGMTGLSYEVGSSKCIDPVAIELSPVSGRVNEEVTITATAAASTLSYQFWANRTSYCSPHHNPNWELVKEWSNENTCSWTPACPGDYTLVVWTADGTNSSCTGIGGMTYKVSGYGFTSSEVGYWSFNGQSPSIAFDSFGRDNDGAIYGASRVVGTCEGALSFDGIDDYVEISDDCSLDMPNGITIEAWVKVEELGEDIPNKRVKTIVSKDQNGELHVNYDGRLEGNVFNSEGTRVFLNGTTSLVLGVWYHVAMTCAANGSLKLYVNGNEDASTPFSGYLMTNTSTIHIGQDHSLYPNRYFKGTIDEVRIYSRSLTQSEIQEDMGC